MREDENGDVECGECGHLESSHEQHPNISLPRPCIIPGCECPDFWPLKGE